MLIVLMLRATACESRNTFIDVMGKMLFLFVLYQATALYKSDATSMLNMKQTTALTTLHAHKMPMEDRLFLALSFAL